MIKIPVWRAGFQTPLDLRACNQGLPALTGRRATLSLAQPRPGIFVILNVLLAKMSAIF
jgi:hypothetical protein